MKSTQPKHSAFFNRACRICELAHVIENVMHDDRKDTLTDAEVLAEAKHVLSLFEEGGTSQSEMLDSDDTAERLSARRQMRALRKLIESAKASYGDLNNYTTGEYIRPATQAERDASIAAAKLDGGHGIIVVDGVSCFVDGE